MQLPGRLSAAIEILDDILARPRPAAMALSDWARNHRFAGSKDRAAIGNLVYDALRCKNSVSYRMNAETGRALVLGTLRFIWCSDVNDIEKLCDGGRFAPAPITVSEREKLNACLPEDADSHICGNYPEWVHVSLERCFGREAVAEGAALARRAPLDIRTNTLKTDRGKLKSALSRFHADETALSPVGLRIQAPQAGLTFANARLPHIEAESAHGKGWFEIQDEASQLAASLTGAKPGMQVADICAGGGGKTLALAAMMKNKGQIHAWDMDRHRLRPIWERLKRAGVRNVQVLSGGEREQLNPLKNRMDIVLADAPCTGTGSWRRKPDAKWRLTPKAMQERISQQQAVLNTAAPLVKPEGRLVYVTCSILPEENSDQADWFLKHYPGFTCVPFEDAWQKAINTAPPVSADGRGDGGLLLTPARHGTDGFFIAVFQRVN